MQTFKEIPYQNYIQLVFNQKNLNESEQQQALIKYKRNAQLLSEIFSFRKTQNQTFKTQNKITQEQLKQFEKQIEREKQIGEEKLQNIKQKSEKYQQLFKSIKQIKSKEEIASIIEELKKNDMYDNTHPFFVEGSPFFLNTTYESYLEVKDSIEQEQSLDGLTFLQIN